MIAALDSMDDRSAFPIRIQNIENKDLRLLQIDQMAAGRANNRHRRSFLSDAAGLVGVVHICLFCDGQPISVTGSGGIYGWDLD